MLTEIDAQAALLRQATPRARPVNRASGVVFMVDAGAAASVLPGFAIMIVLSPWTVLSMALLAGCAPRKAPTETGPWSPDSSDPAPEPTVAPADSTFASPPIHDLALVCPDSETKHIVLTLEFPAGCGPIPTVTGAEDIYLTHLGTNCLSMEVAGSPAQTSRLDSIDLDVRSLVFVSEGCGAAITYGGSIGTVELSFAATGPAFADDNLAGTGRWTAAGGTACDFQITGSFYY